MTYTALTPERYIRSSARQLARLVATKRVSPVQLAEHALARAREFEPRVNAYVCFLEQYATKIAAAREAEARRGTLRGPLHGVPIAIKDNFYLDGYAVTRGSRTSTSYIATHDSPMIERVLAAGAVIIGKTTMPEFGWKGTGTSPLTGITRNPWNPQLNPGGSSAGSAVTVATGAVPIALGSDAGGSIRIPAAFCGTVGFKPTLGRIPVWPGTVTETLSHVGPLSRTVDDARLVVDVCAGPDARDPASYAAMPAAMGPARARLASGALRIGVIAAPFGIASEPAIAAAFAHALRDVRRTVKARYADAAIDAALPRTAFETQWVTGRGLGFANTIAQHRDAMDPGLVHVGELSNAYGLADYFAAIGERRAFNAAACALLERFDVLVMPTMPLLPFAAEAEVPLGGEADAPLPWITWTPFTYPFNLSGQPAISIPCGRSPDGLPIGLQIVGAWGHDQLVLAIARRFEAGLAERTATSLFPAATAHSLPAASAWPRISPDA